MTSGSQEPPAQDLYALLGVPPEASPAQLRQAYRTLLRRHHPDLHSGTGTPGARPSPSPGPSR